MNQFGEILMRIWVWICMELDRVPATFWGIVFGSGLTLSGVVLSNRQNAKNLRKQLKHDSRMKKLEREMTVRKEVYLSATDALATGFNAVMRMTDVGVPDIEITRPFFEKSSAIAKIQLIASIETTEAIARLNLALSDAFMRLSLQRAIVNEMKQTIDRLQRLIDGDQAQQNSWIQHMTEENLKGRPDQTRWAVIQQNYDFVTKRSADSMGAANALRREFTEKHVLLIEKALQELRKISVLVTPAIVRVRAELDFPIDELNLSKIMGVALTEQERAIQEMLTEVRKRASGSAAA